MAVDERNGIQWWSRQGWGSAIPKVFNRFLGPKSLRKKNCWGPQKQSRPTGPYNICSATDGIFVIITVKMAVDEKILNLLNWFTILAKILSFQEFSSFLSWVFLSDGHFYLEKGKATQNMYFITHCFLNQDSGNAFTLSTKLWDDENILTKMGKRWNLIFDQLFDCTVDFDEVTQIYIMRRSYQKIFDYHSKTKWVTRKLWSDCKSRKKKKSLLVRIKKCKW